MISSRNTDSRSEKKGSISATVQSFSSGRFVGKLHNALPSWPATVINNDNGPFDWTEHGEGLLQELIGHKLRQVLNRQCSAMCGKTHTDLATTEDGVVQFCFCYVRKRLRFLMRRKQQVSQG